MDSSGQTGWISVLRLLSGVLTLTDVVGLCLTPESALTRGVAFLLAMVSPSSGEDAGFCLFLPLLFLAGITTFAEEGGFFFLLFGGSARSEEEAARDFFGLGAGITTIAEEGGFFFFLFRGSARSEAEAGAAGTTIVCGNVSVIVAGVNFRSICLLE